MVCLKVICVFVKLCCFRRLKVEPGKYRITFSLQLPAAKAGISFSVKECSIRLAVSATIIFSRQINLALSFHIEYQTFQVFAFRMVDVDRMVCRL